MRPPEPSNDHESNTESQARVVKFPPPPHALPERDPESDKAHMMALVANLVSEIDAGKVRALSITCVTDEGANVNPGTQVMYHCPPREIAAMWLAICNLKTVFGRNIGL